MKLVVVDGSRGRVGLAMSKGGCVSVEGLQVVEYRRERMRRPRRAYTGTLPPIEYPGHFIVKRVTNAGTVRLKKRLVFIANSLKQLPIGLEEVADGIWSIYFCAVLLGRIDERDYIVRA